MSRSKKKSAPKAQTQAYTTPTPPNTTPTPTYVTRRVRRMTLLGLAMTLIGGTLYFTFPEFISNALKSQLQIKDGNDFTKAWTKIPFPAQLDVHLFTIENPDEFVEGAKAKLKELGPYSYE